MQRRAGPLIAACLLGASAVSWLRSAVVGHLAATGTPHMIWPLATFGALAAAAVMLHLRAEPGPLPWRRLVAIAIAIQLAAALSLPLSSNDLWSNVAYGRMAAHGHNPFVGGPAVLPDGDRFRALVDQRWAALPSPYGPLVVLASLVAGLVDAPWLAMVLWKALMLAATLAATVAAAPLVRARFSDDEARARFVALAWCPLLAWELAGQAHNDAVLVLCLVGFVAAATAGRELPAIASLAAGIAAKFVAAPIAGLYLVAIARRAPARAAAYAVALAGFTVVTMLPFWHGPSTLSGLWTNLGPQVGHTARSLGDLLYWSARPLGDGAQRAVFRGFSLVGLVASAAVGILGIVRTRTPAAAIHYALLFFLCSDLFAQTWFQPWYVTWLLPLALVHPDRRWLALVTTYSGLVLCTYALPIDPVSNVIVDVYIGVRAVRLAREGGPSDQGQRETSSRSKMRMPATSSTAR